MILQAHETKYFNSYSDLELEIYVKSCFIVLTIAAYTYTSVKVYGSHYMV